MSFSPEAPHAALLMAALEHAVKESAIAPAIAAETREFLLKLDDDPAAQPTSEVEQGAALTAQWLKHMNSGDLDDADALGKQIENASPTHPFPMAAAVQAIHQLGLVQASSSPKEYYRSPSSPNFGVIQWTLPDNAKVAIIGDWGTGSEDKDYLLDQLLTNNPGIAAILHTGDIYEAGTFSNVRDNFVKPLQMAFQKHGNIPVYAVPGDHEYLHNRAEAYFDMLNTLNGSGAEKQEASYFCLRTKSGGWQILGGDTGYTSRSGNQPGLDGPEKDWHEQKVHNFKGKTIFLTHRQFVSAYDPLNDQPPYNTNAELLSSMSAMLPKISLFLWGHEHRFVPYDIPAYTTKLRLMGGSGRHPKPQQMIDPSIVLPNGLTPPVWTGSDNKYWDDHKKKFANFSVSNHSYAILDLGASQISYYQISAWMNGTPNPTKGSPRLMLKESL